MQVQNFKPTAGTLCSFQDYCKRLEAALDDPPADNKSNKTSGKENGNKKRSQNNNNNKGKKLLHVALSEPYALHQTMLHLKKGSGKAQKSCKNGDRNNKSASINQVRRRFTRSQHFPKKN